MRERSVKDGILILASVIIMDGGVSRSGGRV